MTSFIQVAALPPLPLASLTDQWPFVVLAASIVCLVVCITRLRLHPFLSLIVAALFAGILARTVPASTAAADGTLMITSLTDVISVTLTGFGNTATGISLSIALAAVIGYCLMESGAADRVVRKFLSLFGVKRAALALLVSTYFLSIPIFFDTIFLLMAPLAMALHLRTGKNYLLYVLCVCCGGVITHSLTVPHPGPIAMVDALKIDSGFSILVGICAGVVPAIAGYFVACWLDRRFPVPLREVPGIERSELMRIIEKPDSELPSTGVSILPILLPIFLIAISSAFKVLDGTATSAFAALATTGSLAGLRELIDFLGDRNIALFIGAGIAMWLLIRNQKLTFASVSERLRPPLETAGIIILITAAGGAFGYVIRNAGVGTATGRLAEQFGLNLILLSYVLALIIRIAQGSATVTMLTAASIMFPLLGPDLPYNTIYIFLSIGFASIACSWMNDSGFWVVSRLSGMTEKETLKSFTVLLTAISLAGLAVTFVASKLLPLI